MNDDLNKEKIKLLVILGPTASGKSDLAVEIALQFNGEIISADSRQVYKGLDIGTGKITLNEMKGIPHHLLDVADPKEVFTVQKFKNLTEVAINNIHAQGKLPILCGGTGFYIDAVVDNIILPNVSLNADLRKKLSQVSTEDLYSDLATKDPQTAERIDKQNRVRLVRALEIVEGLGTVPSVKKGESTYAVLKIGFLPSLEELQQRIERRLITRLENGMLDEMKKLHEQGLSYERMYDLGLEYRHMSLFLQNKVTYEEMVERLKIEIFQYAKRQLKWWKKDVNVLWFLLEEKEKIIKLVAEFFK